jgi:dihydroneopterin aldolase
MSRKVKVTITFHSQASTKEVNDALNYLATSSVLTDIAKNEEIDWTVKRAR